MKKLLKIIVIAVLAIWIAKSMPSGDKEKPTAAAPTPPSPTMQASAPTPAVQVSAPKSTCSIGSPSDGSVVAVTGEFEPRTTPSAKGARIKNEKASSILKSTQYHQIDSSTTVKRLCSDGGWSEVQIVTPEWLTFVKGWVPDKVLRGIERTDGGGRIYEEADFIWDDSTKKYKRQIVTVVNKIARDHAGCSDLDTGSVDLSPSRSKPHDAVFFVTCNPPSGAPFNVWFRPTDADKSFAAAKPISQADAVLACERAAKAAATHPSTVDFSRFLDVAYSARQDGRVSLDSSFTAKNGFNLELKYRIRCLFDGNKFIDSNIVEAD